MMMGFTCILIANLMGSDSEPMPTPIHLTCWKSKGERQGYARVVGSRAFVVEGKEYSSLPQGLDGDPVATCWLCNKTIF